MIHSIIDVGSNTIRMVIYEIKNDTFCDIANERDFARLITYVEDGVLSEEGKKRAVGVLSKMAEVCREKKCDKVHCFATASLRSVKNIDDVIAEIKEKTGIDMEIISGSDEAKYDFYGLMSGIDEKSGIGFDLGGGSCQLFKFLDSELNFFESLKIGGQVIYKKFVSNDLPTKTEMQNIYDYIIKTLTPLTELKDSGYPYIYAMGGAARNAAKYIISSKKLNAGLEKFRISKETLEELCCEICFTQAGRENLLKIIPDRLRTIIPGIITIIAVLDFCNSRGIEIVMQGVREGFLYERVLLKSLD